MTPSGHCLAPGWTLASPSYEDFWKGLKHPEVIIGGVLLTSLRRRTMMRREKFSIANIYVPIKRRATLKPETVQEIA